MCDILKRRLECKTRTSNTSQSTLCAHDTWGSASVHADALAGTFLCSRAMWLPNLTKRGGEPKSCAEISGWYLRSQNVGAQCDSYGYQHVGKNARDYPRLTAAGGFNHSTRCRGCDFSRHFLQTVTFRNTSAFSTASSPGGCPERRPATCTRVCRLRMKMWRCQHVLSTDP
jgi:hypothetical protein